MAYVLTARRTPEAFQPEASARPDARYRLQAALSPVVGTNRFYDAVLRGYRTAVMAAPIHSVGKWGREYSSTTMEVANLGVEVDSRFGFMGATSLSLCVVSRGFPTAYGWFPWWSKFLGSTSLSSYLRVNADRTCVLQINGGGYSPLFTETWTLPTDARVHVVTWKAPNTVKVFADGRKIDTTNTLDQSVSSIYYQGSGSSDFFINGAGGGYEPAPPTAFFAIAPTAWGDARDISAQPYLLLRRRNRAIFLPSSIAYQYLRPVSDVSAGAWTGSAGGNLYSNVDETVASGADYISTTTVGSECELALGAGDVVVDPQVSTGHTVSLQVGTGGIPSGKSLVTTLKQGGGGVRAYSLKRARRVTQPQMPGINSKVFPFRPDSVFLGNDPRSTNSFGANDPAATWSDVYSGVSRMTPGKAGIGVRYFGDQGHTVCSGVLSGNAKTILILTHIDSTSDGALARMTGSVGASPFLHISSGTLWSNYIWDDFTTDSLDSTFPVTTGLHCVAAGHSATQLSVAIDGKVATKLVSKGSCNTNQAIIGGTDFYVGRQTLLAAFFWHQIYIPPDLLAKMTLYGWRLLPPMFRRVHALPSALTIAQWTDAGPISADTTLEHTLTAGQADSITDYNALHVLCKVTSP